MHFLFFPRGGQKMAGLFRTPLCSFLPIFGKSETINARDFIGRSELLQPLAKNPIKKPPLPCPLLPEGKEHPYLSKNSL